MGLCFLTLVLGMIVPLATGYILSMAKEDSVKILIHQSYIVLAIFAALLLMFVLRKIRGGDKIIEEKAEKEEKHCIDLKDAFITITKNKEYMFFMICLFFYYSSWQLDWTLWYYGRVHYLGLDEFMLSVSDVAGTFAQFIAVGFWKKINDKMGASFGAPYGIWGLALSCFCIIFSTQLYEQGHALLSTAVFMVIWFIASLPQPVITLNLPLCLMEVADPKYSALCISLFTILTTFTNAIMPAVGVAIHNALGGDVSAFRETYLIICFLRIIAGGLFFIRWRKMRKTA